MDISKLKVLIKEQQERYKELDYEYGECDEEIENLQDKKEIISNEMDNLEDNIGRLSKLLTNTIMQERLRSVTDIEDFKSDFVKTSIFCDKKFKRPLLEHVNITENELQAVDGYRAIVITNNNIPEELKNTKIHWTISENFKENISDIKLEFLDIERIIPKKENAKYKIENISIDNFNSIFKVEKEEHSTFITDLVKLSYKDLKIAFQEQYLKEAFMVLGDTTFDIYFFNSVKPILIENKRIKIVLLPVRIA